VTIIDRLEGARENLAAEGIELIALFTSDDFRT
jgi:orotate phosphoribosyltransferase